MSLRLRIIAVFTACIALPVAAGWASLWLSASNATRTQAATTLQADARAAMRTVEEHLARNLAHLKAWSTMPMMQEVLINDDGGELAQALADLARAYPDFESLTITDARGAIVATTDRTLARAASYEAGGTRAAISGRTTQETLPGRHSLAVRFTVPLVAGYDRRTVIGTLTGMVGLSSIFGDMIKAVRAEQAAPGYALATKEPRQVLFATARAEAMAPVARSLDLAARPRPVNVTIAGEAGLAAIAGSGSRILGQDPGLAVIAFQSRLAMAAPAASLSDTFLAVSILAAMASLCIAWRWATPLVRLDREASAVFKAPRAAPGEPPTPQDSFAPLARAFARLKQAREERDALAARAQELALAIAVARDHARDSNERLRQIAGGLTAHMTEVTGLVELINRENIAAAGRRQPQPRLDELNRAALDLLEVIREAVEAVTDEAGETQSVPPSSRLPHRQQSA
ncbi:MAG: hypothetical protein KJS87_04210 [Alphaproteobacteria bacterium]|nr:hypothetical protein [Alphaproteobacteria bacterium]